MVRPIYRFVNSVAEINNKIQDFETCDEIIDNPIYGNRWYEVIDKDCRT